MDKNNDKELQFDEFIALMNILQVKPAVQALWAVRMYVHSVCVLRCDPDESIVALYKSH